MFLTLEPSPRIRVLLGFWAHRCCPQIRACSLSTQSDVIPHSQNFQQAFPSSSQEEDQNVQAATWQGESPRGAELLSGTFQLLVGWTAEIESLRQGDQTLRERWGLYSPESGRVMGLCLSIAQVSPTHRLMFP